MMTPTFLQMFRVWWGLQEL